MMVADASAVLAALLNAGPAREVLAEQQVHVPDLIDVEVTSGLRRQVISRGITEDQGRAALNIWRRLGVVRYPTIGFLVRMWELKANISAYDASYIALAEHLGASLLTADRRLTLAPGPKCPITLVPR